ncbi:MAG: ribosome maturation factor RimM [Fimbriimonas sp.]
MSESPLPENLQPVGRIAGAFGLRGQLKIEPYTDFYERFEVGAKLQLKGKWLTVLAYRLQKNRPLIQLEGIKSVEAAQALQWEELIADVSERPDLEEDEFMTDDLIGLQVRLEDGEIIGKIDEVMVMPAHDVIVVGEIMIPAIKQFVVDVDLDEEVVTVRLIPGMRGEEPEEA